MSGELKRAAAFHTGEGDTLPVAHVELLSKGEVRVELVPLPTIGDRHSRVPLAQWVDALPKLGGGIPAVANHDGQRVDRSRHHRGLGDVSVRGFTETVMAGPMIARMQPSSAQ